MGRNESSMKKFLGILLCIVWMAAALAACTARPSGTASAPAAPSVAQKSWDTCVADIQTERGVASGDAGKFNPASVTNLGEGEVIVVVYYPKTAAFFRCDIQKGSDGVWKVASLESMDPAALPVFGARR
jgi:hypothetical protein